MTTRRPTDPQPVHDPRRCSECGTRLPDDALGIELSAGVAGWCDRCLDRVAGRNRVAGWGDAKWR
jgi:hypothetical protein